MNFEIRSIEDVRTWLSSQQKWTQLSKFDTAVLLTNACIAYGALMDKTMVSPLADLYRCFYAMHSSDERRHVCKFLIDSVDRCETGAAAVLPIVVCEDHRDIASSAALELLACGSPMKDGRPYGLVELESLIRYRTPVNMGAVFGAIALFGDVCVRPSLDELKSYLTHEEVQEAATCDSGLLSSDVLDFWLSWAEELVHDESEVGQRKFGSVASALILRKRKAAKNEVIQVRRPFPATKHRVEHLKRWSIQEYGMEIAPRLYRLEETERTPKVIPHVLNEWDLKPTTPESDWAQF